MNLNFHKKQLVMKTTFTQVLKKVLQWSLCVLVLFNPIISYGASPSEGNPYGLDDSNPVSSIDENFESMSTGAILPQGWTNVDVQGDRLWEVKSFSGNQYAQMSAYNGDGTYQTLMISPAINFDNIEPTATFDWAAAYANGATLEIHVMQLDGSTTTVASIEANAPTNGYGDFITETLDLSGISGVAFLAFEYKGIAGSTTTTYQIDNFSVLSQGPSLSASPEFLQFGLTTSGTTSTALDVSIEGRNLTAIPTFQITGPDATNFEAIGSLSTDGGTISITFSPEEGGAKSASLTVSADGVSESVALYGSGSVLGAYLTEDFSSITSGNNTSTSGANSQWAGNGNFPTVDRAYQAGGAVKLGTSSSDGSVTSKSLDLSANNGNFVVSLDVKGWTSVEGDLEVIVSGLTSQIITYSSTMNGLFETKRLQFSGGQPGSTITILTRGGRAYVDNVQVYSDGVSNDIKTPEQDTINVYSDNGQLKVYSNTDAGNIEVFNMTGAPIYSKPATIGIHTFSVPPNQLLIVKAGNSIRKVIVR